MFSDMENIDINYEVDGNVDFIDIQLMPCLIVDGDVIALTVNDVLSIFPFENGNCSYQDTEIGFPIPDTPPFLQNTYCIRSKSEIKTSIKSVIDINGVCDFAMVPCAVTNHTVLPLSPCDLLHLCGNALEGNIEDFTKDGNTIGTDRSSDTPEGHLFGFSSIHMSMSQNEKNNIPVTNFTSSNFQEEKRHKKQFCVGDNEFRVISECYQENHQSCINVTSSKTAQSKTTNSHPYNGKRCYTNAKFHPRGTLSKICGDLIMDAKFDEALYPYSAKLLSICSRIKDS